MLKISCIQTSSQNDLEKNLKKIRKQIEQASAISDLIALPENVAFMAANIAELKQNSYPEQENPILEFFIQQAKEFKKWILIGSIAIKSEKSDKLYNRSFLINDKGKIVTSYDKIHLYDVSVSNGESHQESKNFEYGSEAIIAKTPFATLGMSICYDVRFPYLYRHLAKKGAQIIFVPAAFTKYTGKAHWEVLLRARAIENSCYIVAPAQCGSHPANRKTYGNSMIINPWGEIIAKAGTKPEIITAEIDLDLIKKVRKELPSLEHDRVL